MNLFKPKQPNNAFKAVGDRSEAAVIARLLEVGYGVLLPFGDNSRYDLVLEDGDGTFHRIQCKTGKSNGEYIDFATASSHNHTKNKGRHDYRGQIDYFAVYCPQNKNVYLIPVDHVGRTEGRLRLVATGNNQEERVRWAKDYEI